jgi:hypothetical protein
MLSQLETKLVLNKFPKFELCYEIITHKKVLDSNVIMAIPEGKKCLAWFTNYKNCNTCFLLDIEFQDSGNKRINNFLKTPQLQIINIDFDDELSLSFGTIFYGTFFSSNNNKFNYFCFEDIYYYKGKSSQQLNYLCKLELFKNIFESEISQIPISNNYTIFGLPFITNDFNVLLKEIPSLPYEVRNIKFRYFENNNSRKVIVMNYFKPGSQNISKNVCQLKSNTFEAIFKITADIEPDIYNLFVKNNGIEEYYDNAFIPDYKTSVLMNKLFRNIKENNNLDAIEESDNEEEFEDNRDDKYVYLDREYNMYCIYNHKFKKWYPVSLAEQNDNIVSSNILASLFKKNPTNNYKLKIEKLKL